MTQAQTLAKALNLLIKAPQFSNSKVRAAARQDGNIDWPRSKALNEGFNPEVDGCESFVMRDGSRCEWAPGRHTYVARAG